MRICGDGRFQESRGSLNDGKRSPNQSLHRIAAPQRLVAIPESHRGRHGELSVRRTRPPASMPAKKMDFEVVREIAKALPDVEESSLHGVPSLKVSGRLLTCPALHKSAKPNSLVVRIGFEERAELMAAEPGIYYVTDHYVNHPAVLVRLAQIDRDSLRNLLGLAWRFVSSKKRAGRRRGPRPHPAI